ncbi:MAG: hypothetical protein E7432_04295 [Ruminococcaceae bacterium]|nr:hypothetical protein [Oscillospiraceae bacterium]
MIDVYLDAQRAVLGCLIIDADLCAEGIFGAVRDEHFSDPEYRALFIKAKELYHTGKIDRLVFQHETPEYRNFITEIVYVTPTAHNWREYIEVLLDEYKLYQASLLREALPDMVRKNDIDTVRQKVAELNRLFEEPSAFSSPSSVGELFMEFADEMDREAEYIRFGFKSLDERLYVEKGDYVVIGARPSVGKTAIALNVAHEMAKKYKTIFFSFETSKSKLSARYFANVLGVDFGKIKQRTLSDEEKGHMLPAFAGVSSRKLYLEEASGSTAQEICAIALREKAEIIFVDYLGLVSGEGQSDYERVSAISKYFHIFAQKHKVLVVLLSQLNRETTKGDRPALVNLRDSGQIEQDADTILLLHKPKEDDRMRELIIAKNKEGEVGTIALDFDGKYQRFFESQRAHDIFKEIRKIGKASAKESAAKRVFGAKITELTDEDEIEKAQQILPL